VWLIAHPLQNSLPASLEILARVKRDGGDGRIFFLTDAKDTATLADLESTLSDAAAMRTLAGARLGRVGDSSDWLVASSHSADAVRGSWGVEVVPVPIDTLHRYIAAEGIPEDGEEFQFFKDAEAIREPTPADVGTSVGVYRALKRLVREEKLDALTLRCFDLVLDEKTTGCFALSRLNDEGVIAGCEGDIPAALALLWVKRLTGLTGWMANPARLDAAAGRLLLAHCTVPRSIVKKYTVRSHFESSLGVGISGEFARGPVTLVRLGGEKLERLWVTEGAITATSSADGLCRTQIECTVPSEAIESMLRDPLGNHVVVVQGHHEERLRGAFSMVKRA
jgi:L-fucose isomerase-like protein